MSSPPVSLSSAPSLTIPHPSHSADPVPPHAPVPVPVPAPAAAPFPTPQLTAADFMTRSHTSPVTSTISSSSSSVSVVPRSVYSSSSDSPPPTPDSLKNRVNWRKKLILCLVGLPARGKSYIAYKLVGYLRWRGMRAQLFNVGKHRRHMVHTPQDAKFFDANNVEAQKQRDLLAFQVLNEMLDWLEFGGDVAVFDATNTTNKRRWEVVRAVNSRSPQLRVIFIESICDDKKVLESNYLVKAQNSPDYKNMPLDEALADLRLRIANYEKVYEPLMDDHLSYLKLINLNSKVICNRIHGQLTHIIASFLMSIHVRPRPIFLSRAGACEGEESYLPLITSPGEREQEADRSLQLPAATSTAGLTERGKTYAKALENFIKQKCLDYWQKELEEAKANSSAKEADQGRSPVSSAPSSSEFGPSDSSRCSVSDLQLDTARSSNTPLHMAESGIGGEAHPAIGLDLLPLVIYTSTLPRAVQTIEGLAEHALLVESQSALNMLDTGICKGMPMTEIRAKMPGELDKWQSNKYEYRWPGGESQMDKAKSLEPLVMEIERQTFPVLVISHASTLQVLYGYFLGASRPVDCYYKLWIPAHTVIELIPHQYGWIERRHDLRTEQEKEREKEQKMKKQHKDNAEGKEGSESHNVGSGSVDVGGLNDSFVGKDGVEDESQPEPGTERAINTQFYAEN